MSGADKTRMIALPYGEKNYDNNMLNRFQLIPERHGRTDRQTDRQPAPDGQTDRQNCYRASVC